MKKIEAVIRCEKFSYVKDALAKAGFTSLTTYDVKGRGRQSGVVGVVDGKTIRADLLPKTKVEMIVEDKDVNAAIDVIVTTAATGVIGDGKIFVSPIEEVIRVRTRERGSDAI